MPSGLPVQGTLSYNGFSFDNSDFSVEYKPIRDAAQRVVTCVSVVITVNATISGLPGSPTTDAQLDNIRALLAADAGELIFTTKGFGLLHVNKPDGTGQRDARWGPKTQIIRFKKVGAAAELTWVCETVIPCDESGGPWAQGILEFNWRVQVTIDGSGYSRRTISGHLIIPQTRATPASTNLTDNADRWWEKVLPDIPVGFKESSKDWTLSEDKCRIDFTVVHEEMPPNIPPPGIVEVSADQTVQSISKWPGALWSVTFNATYEVDRGLDASLAYGCFVLLVNTRIATMKKNATSPDKRVANLPGKKGVMIPRSLMMRENIYDKKQASFSCVYHFVTGIDEILKASGLWTPLPDSNYRDWLDSMSVGPYQPRGNAGLFFKNSDDALITLCNGLQPTKPTPTTKLTPGPKPPPINPPLPPQPILPGGGGGGDFPIDVVPPELSWLDYHCWTWLVVVDGTVILKKLDPKQPSPISTPSTSEGAALANLPDDPIAADVVAAGIAAASDIAGEIADQIGSAVAGLINLYPDAGKPKITVQQRSDPTFYVYLTGYGIRAGFPVPIPILLGYGGVNAYPDNDETCYLQAGQIDNWMGLPIFASAWRQRYVLDGMPGALIPILANPLG